MTSWHCSSLVFASCGHPNDPLQDGGATVWIVKALYHQGTTLQAAEKVALG